MIDMLSNNHFNQDVGSIKGVKMVMMQTSSFSIYSLMVQFFLKKEPVQKVKEGTVLFQEKDPVEYVYLLLKGSVALGRVHLRGKDFTLKILNNREFIAEYQLFKANPHYHVLC